MFLNKLNNHLCDVKYINEKFKCKYNEKEKGKNYNIKILISIFLLLNKV